MSETAQPCDFTECENTDRHLWPETSPVDAPEEKLFVTSAGGIGINIGGHVIVQPLREWHRLAASQPDREASREAIASMLARMLYNDATLDNCTESERESWLTAADAIRSLYRASPLLSGAGTKSDGGEPSTRTAGGFPVAAAPSQAEETGVISGTRQDPQHGTPHGSGVTGGESAATLLPGPSDPSPGPDVRRRVLDILNVVAPAVENLARHQEQCDMDGVMVKVSRQALDEVLNAVNEVALVSALTRPLGGDKS